MTRAARPSWWWAVVWGLAASSPAAAHAIAGKLALEGAPTPENSVVYLAAPGRSFPPPPTVAVMDQKLRVYQPHVLVVMKGQKVMFPNSDLVRHNVFSPSRPHRFNLGIYPSGVYKEELFEQPGVVALLCNVHTEMSAYIVVVETPWFARLGADGAFRFEGVPPGKYEVIAWHEGRPEVRTPIEVHGDLTLSLTVGR